MSEITLIVEGYPPAKGEALSMLRPGHSHAPRVRRLLQAARDEVSNSGFTGLGSQPIGLEVVVRSPRDRNRSDATNYLGGLGDVLEGKGRRGQIEHLGDLRQISLFDNDRQLEEVRYRWEESAEPSYTVRLWELAT